MKKIKMMFKNYKLDHEIKIEKEVIESVEEYIYLDRKDVQIMKKKIWMR